MNRRDGGQRPGDCDPYYKKDITLDVGGRGLKFRVSQTLFSSYGIDAGTELLLRTLHREERRVPKGAGPWLRLWTNRNCLEVS